MFSCSQRCSQPAAHGFKFLNALDPLNTVFENDIRVVVGEEVRPIRFALTVVGARPEVTDTFDGQRFQNFRVVIYGAVTHNGNLISIMGSFENNSCYLVDFIS